MSRPARTRHQAATASVATASVSRRAAGVKASGASDSHPASIRMGGGDSLGRTAVLLMIEMVGCGAEALAVAAETVTVTSALAIARRMPSSADDATATVGGGVVVSSLARLRRRIYPQANAGFRLAGATQQPASAPATTSQRALVRWAREA